MGNRVKLSLTAGLLGSAIVLGAATVFAAGDGATAIKERQAIMKSIGAHMGGIKAGVAAGDGKAVASHAKAINALAGVAGNFFPKGSGPEAGETRALPKIWEEWDGFVKAAGVLVAESAKLASVAEGGGDAAAMGAQFGKMGKEGCGGCHKPYRKPK